MFRYVGDISKLSHFIIENYCLNFNVAVDCTLGRGADTDFLSKLFSKVYSFDIQKEPVEEYKHKNKSNVELILDSHENLDLYIKEKVDCLMYNFGYLPGGNKEITTKASSSLKSIKIALELLNSSGIVALCLYKGHDEGKLESEAIISFVSDLPKDKFGVMSHKFINRFNAPELIIIEKK